MSCVTQQEGLVQVRVPAQDLHVAKEIAGALSIVHEAGVAYNDITADNVLVITEGKQLTVKMIDFSCELPCRLNKSDNSGNLFNNDLYSLGLFFHNMITLAYCSLTA
eukprot:15358296-Ditylum_brightwellii.AAC.1